MLFVEKVKEAFEKKGFEFKHNYGGHYNQVIENNEIKLGDKHIGLMQMRVNVSILIYECTNEVTKSWTPIKSVTVAKDASDNVIEKRIDAIIKAYNK